MMTALDQGNELMGRLGKFKTGKSCLYLNRLDDVDQNVLREMILASIDRLKKMNP
jgi:hypothetical protein